MPQMLQQGMSMAPQQMPPQGGPLMGGQVPPVTLEGKPVMVPPVRNEQ